MLKAQSVQAALTSAARPEQLSAFSNTTTQSKCCWTPHLAWPLLSTAQLQHQAHRLECEEDCVSWAQAEHDTLLSCVRAEYVARGKRSQQREQGRCADVDPDLRSVHPATCLVATYHTQLSCIIADIIFWWLRDDPGSKGDTNTVEEQPT